MAQIITISISDFEEKVLLNDLLDINEWFQLAKSGKINNCLKRASKQYEQIAIQEQIETMPTTPENKVKALFERTDYKNRTTRDAEEAL